MVNLSHERVGKVNENNYGSKMIIEEYVNASNIWVRFIETKNKVRTNYHAFITGEVKNPYDKCVHGVGYIGEGNHEPSINRQNTQKYIIWIGMLQRCYSEKYHKNKPTYKDCQVSEEWHNFQNFGDWYDENYYEVNDEKMCLDKDILIKGNKIYSPKTCVFVPSKINVLFTKRNAKRGNYPIGVSLRQNNNKIKYRARCNNGEGKVVNIGDYNSSQEAFVAYKSYKEKLIKQVAEKYKPKLPSKLFESLLNYEVEITD